MGQHRVSRAELESLLASVAAQTTDPRAGIFGPDSMSWKINREAALFLGAGRAALLQLAHPWVGTALQQHSSLLGDPLARVHNTFRIVFTMVFGSLDQALAAARHLHTLHTGIRGEMPETVAEWPRGTHYEANEIAALRWVYATLIESAVFAYGSIRPFSTEERAQYYNESKTMAALFGLPAAALPEDWSGFHQYVTEMSASRELGVGSPARAMGHAILRGAGSWVRVPRWYRALTAEWLGPRFREEFELPWSAADQRTAERALQWLPRVWSGLPAPVRFVGPWHEAEARLRGRRPGKVTLIGNRFWIGQTLLPFANLSSLERQQ
ncbi:MAG: oxygenase MpaB family protein [Acidobacteriaceae bacterium]